MVSIALPLAGLLALYGSTLNRLVYDWVTDSDSAYNFVLPVLAVWLLWRERRRLAALPRKPSWLGFAGLSLAATLHVLGTLSAEFYTARVSLVFALAALILYLAGWPLLRSAVLPLGLLLLAVPIPAIVYTLAALPMEAWASRLAAWLLSMGGVTVLRQGSLLIFPASTLEVDQVCGGMRSAAALAGVALVLGSLTRQSRWIRLSLVLACVPVAVFSAALRLCAAGFAVAAFGYPWPEGLLRPTLGVAAFAVSFALIFLLQSVLPRLGGRPPVEYIA